MSQQIATQSRRNWTVRVFRCPTRRWSNILVELWRFIGDIEGADIPHFLIRETRGGSHIVSLRVLRDPSREQIVEEALSSFLVQHQLEHVQVQPDDPRDGWITDHDPTWNRERCGLLNRLSEFVASLAESNMFGVDDRISMAHLFAIMLGLYEMGTAIGGYIDLATGTIRRYQLR